jgi:ligand-binding SRPBCC domain-containing protein
VVRIELSLVVAAPAQRCFDLSRSVEFHQDSTGDSNEVAVGGVTAGLLGHGDTVTWEATHLGVRQRLTSRITQFSPQHHFRDEQVRGAFSFLCHDHFFHVEGNATRVVDVMEFAAPLGIFGEVAEQLVLERYMQRFLQRRLQAIKRVAESDEWLRYLAAPTER